MKQVRVILCGIGKVGTAFLELLASRSLDVRESHGIDFHLVAAVDVGGGALCNEGLAIANLLAYLKRPGKLDSYPDSGRTVNGRQAIADARADVLVEATPTNLKDGEPGLTHIRAALESGMHVVSANKGPLVLRYAELHDLARENRCSIKIGAATAAALPTVDVGNYCLAGANILEVQGILNGTTNYILTRMDKEGVSYEQALEEAQQAGIAETDPSLDVEGWDTANKMLLIANRVMGASLKPADLSVEGIPGIDPARLLPARRNNKVVKLLGTATRTQHSTSVRVCPEELDIDHPLAAVNGSEKAITYMTDTMDRVTVVGGKSSPAGAAAALYKDLLNIF